MAKQPQKDVHPKLWVRVNARSTWGSCRLVFDIAEHVLRLSWKWMKKKLWTCQKGVLCIFVQIEKFVKVWNWCQNQHMQVSIIQHTSYYIQFGYNYYILFNVTIWISSNKIPSKQNQHMQVSIIQHTSYYHIFLFGFLSRITIHQSYQLNGILLCLQDIMLANLSTSWFGLLLHKLSFLKF